MRARERRWAEHEATVTGKLDVVGGRVGEVERQIEVLEAKLVEQGKARDEAMKVLEGRVDEYGKKAEDAKAEAAKVEAAAPVGMVERTVNGLLDEVKRDHTAAESVLPYLALLVAGPSTSGDRTAAQEVAHLIVDRALASPIRANSHARLCRDLAKLVPASARIPSHDSGFVLTGPAAFHHLVDARCLARFALAPNKTHAAAFVAELFARGVATKETAHAVLAQLLVDASGGDGEAAGAAYQVLAKVGQKLDVEGDKAVMDAHFARMKRAAVSVALWNKVGVLVQLREKGWVQESTNGALVGSASSVTSIA